MRRSGEGACRQRREPAEEDSGGAGEGFGRGRAEGAVLTKGLAGDKGGDGMGSNANGQVCFCARGGRGMRGRGDLRVLSNLTFLVWVMWSPIFGLGSQI